MSGLGEMGYEYGANVNALQVAQKDIDQYDLLSINNPVANFGWFGTANGGTAAAGPALVQVNQLADWPRNIAYSVTGQASGTYGGTFTVNGVDQFGVSFTETVVVASAANGGTVYGTAVATKFLSGTFTSQGSSGGSVGTASVGLGTASNGSASSNWFGLLTKITGTSEIKMITWTNNGTTTALNKGTSIGTLVGFNLNGSVPSNAFQGTSGVAITDSYRVVLKPVYDNTGKGTMSGL